MAGFLDNKKTAESGGSEKAKKATLRRSRTLAETKNWYTDRYQSVSVQRNILFIFTLILLVGLGIEVMMITTMMNSKTFEPFVVEVEERSGIITQVSTKGKETYSQEEAVLRSLLVQYVRARESYDIETYRYNYSQLVRLFSSPDVYNEFRQIFAVTNKDSPVNFGRTARREVNIKSLTFLDDTKRKVQARIELKDVALPARTVNATTNIVAVITFDFKELDLSVEERYINPLGFQIQSYIAEKELI